MDNATFARNALKTFSNKPAQYGLRRVAGNLKRTHIMHAAFGLLSEMAETFEVMAPWMIGAQQLSPAMITKGMDEMGDVGYFMALLSRRLKVRLPGSGKKLRLKGMTPAQAFHKMMTLANVIASQQKKNFYGPVLIQGEGFRQKLDAPATEEQERQRYEKMSVALLEFASLYWQVSNEVFGVAPAVLFEKNIAKLAVRYPDQTFSAAKVESKNPEAEAKAQA